MRFSVSQTSPDNQYPYTHRIEFLDDGNSFDQVNSWIQQGEIPCYVIPFKDVSSWHKTVAVYINEPELTAFLLKWS